MPPDRTQARIGDLVFDTRYADPVVNVDTEANTVEKNTIDDTIIIQHLGERADRIRIDGIIHEDDVNELDNLVSSGEVKLRTQRWTGTVLVMSTASDYTHSYDIAPPEDVVSEWLYEVTIDCIAVDEVPNKLAGGGNVGLLRN